MSEQFMCQVCQQILLLLFSFPFYIQPEYRKETEDKNLSLKMLCLKPHFSQGMKVKALAIILNIRVPQQCTVSTLKKRAPGF